MRNFPGFVSARAGLGSITVASALTLCTFVRPPQAEASGPIERLVEVLLNPANPQQVVVRWGIASHGYLFSNDGGHTFSALCSTAVDANVTRISSQGVPQAASTLLDTSGRVVFGQIKALYTDDGHGCHWSKQLDGKWPFSIKRDPKNQDELLAVVNSSTPTDAQSYLMRRAVDGVTWTQLAPLVPPVANQFAYGSDLIASVTPTGDTQMYASVSYSDGLGTGSMAPVAHDLIVGSSDGGKTWSTSFEQPADTDAQDDFTLLAIDPNDPKRILAVVYRDTSADTLMLSEDQGKTFTAYQELRETSGAAFGSDGRVYISDAGDSSGLDSVGGLYTAAKLGDPLTLVPNTSMLDCITIEPTTQKLYACRRDKVGFLDPTSGQFDELVEISNVPSLVTCDDVDVGAACSGQLNAGASWCCAGHYPFTPFCGQYDVTTSPTGGVLYCGLSGRVFDAMSGRAPADASVPLPDAAVSSGAPDASLPNTPAAKPDAGTEPTKNSDSGCAVSPAASSSSYGVFSGLGLALVVSRTLRRRRFAARRAAREVSL